MQLSRLPLLQLPARFRVGVQGREQSVSLTFVFIDDVGVELPVRCRLYIQPSKILLN